jgi:hypothetical protein
MLDTTMIASNKDATGMLCHWCVLVEAHHPRVAAPNVSLTPDG